MQKQLPPTVEEALQNTLSQADHIEKCCVIIYDTNGTMTYMMSGVTPKDLVWAFRRIEHELMLSAYATGSVQ